MPKAKPKRRPIDWEKIEAAYRAGIVSLYELAETHRISRALIQKRAKAHGWTRNLAERIRQAAVAKAVAPEVASHDEAATVEEMSDAAAKILRRHQKRADRLQTIIDGLEDRLQRADELPISVASQAVNNLANARKTAFGLERQAHGLGDDNGAASPDEAPRIIERRILRA